MERFREVSKKTREKVQALILGTRLFKECILAAMHEEGERGDIVHKANIVELVTKEFRVDKSEALDSPVVGSLGGDALSNELRVRWGEGKGL